MFFGLPSWFSTRLRLIRHIQVPLKTIPDSALNIKLSSEGRISNTVVQTVKSKKIPRSLYRDIMEFRMQNQEISFTTFDEKQMQEFMRDNFYGEPIYHAFNAARLGISKSDIFRYCYLFLRGGIYLDINKYTEFPLRILLRDESYDFVVSQESHDVDNALLDHSLFYPYGLKPRLFVMWLMAIRPRHPLMQSVINEVEEWYRINKGRSFPITTQAVWSSTGPIAFTRAILKQGCLNESSTLLFADADYGMTTWPKFQSSRFLYDLHPHYSNLKNQVIFSS